MHVHLLIQTFQTTISRPIDIREADKAWTQLTGQRTQPPHPLKRYSEAEARNVFRYIAKSLRYGEKSVKFLAVLDDYIQSEGIYQRQAQQLRVFILRTYNAIFCGVHKRGFFGSWYGKGKPIVTHAKPTANRCHCESKARFVSVPQ